MLIAPLLAAALAAGPFPMPSIDGKAIAVVEGRKVFKLPMRFEKVRAFYEERFGAAKEPDVSMVVTGTAGKRLVTLTSKRAGDSWKKALVKEGEVETLVEVTAVLRLKEEEITGNGRPLVEFVIGRSGDVDQVVGPGIDKAHTEAIRK